MYRLSGDLSSLTKLQSEGGGFRRNRVAESIGIRWRIASEYAGRPGRHVLVCDNLGIDMAAKTQGHHEDPRLQHDAREGIQDIGPRHPSASCPAGEARDPISLQHFAENQADAIQAVQPVKSM